MREVKTLLYNRKFWLIIASIMFAIGLAGGINILIHGEHAMGTSDKVPWGGLIAFYIFFVGASAGLSLVSSLGHVFNIHRYEVIGKRSLLAGIALLLMGFFIMAFDLGKPLNMFYLLLSPNISSGIFWMGAIYGLLLLLLIVEFYFIVIKKNCKYSLIIGTAVIIVDVAAHSNLGSVFGTIVSRPFWNGPYIPIYLIFLAILLGLGVLSVMFYIIDKLNTSKDKFTYNNEHIVTTLGKLMALFLVITVFFAGWNVYTNLYGQALGQYESIMSLLWGPLSFNFWFFEVIVMLGLPFVLLFWGKFQPKWVFIAGILTIIGNIFARVDIVLAGQIVPHEFIFGSKTGYIDPYVLTTGYVKASVSISEWAVFIGALGGSILIYLIGEKLFHLDMEGEAPADKITHEKILKLLKLN
ncbi:MAG: NrfD/PsrC family molybdoenzyme membrane anchor subunit [Vulcanibacillus sp.]